MTIDEPAAHALAGLKVLDLTWALTGPAATRVLADYGATVVKVESGQHVDPIREGPPFKDGVHGPDRSAEMVNYNAGKLAISIDPGIPAGRELVLDLVRWADIVAEAFRPGVMASWDLGYEVLHAANPRAIVLSTSLFGQTGPDSQGRGFGVQGAGQAGFIGPLGWPDREPSLPGAYTDFIASRFVTIALLAAHKAREGTGRGQWIDLAQIEAGIQFLGPEVLDFQVNGREVQRMGNYSPGALPHGVFPCRGEDSWIAVSVSSDREWAALCSAGAGFEWACSPKFTTFLLRRRNEELLNEALAAWTAPKEASTLADQLQAAGVPAKAVINPPEAESDPQLVHRRHFTTVLYDPFGEVVVENPRAVLSRTPGRAGPAATLGQHNDYVLRTLLGKADDEIMQAVIAGALG